MNLGIAGKVAMVAAASKGIGLATAKLLAEEGCRVSICGRTEETLEAAEAEIQGESRSYVVDVADAEDLAWWLEQTQQDLGTPEILITNTGGPPAGLLSDLSEEQWQSGFESTLMNVVRLVNLVSPGMVEAKWGRIVHVTSLVAKEASDILAVSSTLRGGLMNLTRLQARQLAPAGVTVNAVLPGHTLTDRQRHLADVRAKRENITPEEALEKQAAEVPMGRLADPREIAAPIVMLCGKDSGYISGVNLLVDGALTRSAG